MQGSLYLPMFLLRVEFVHSYKYGLFDCSVKALPLTPHYVEVVWSSWVASGGLVAMHGCMSEGTFIVSIKSFTKCFSLFYYVLIITIQLLVLVPINISTFLVPLGFLFLADPRMFLSVLFPWK